MTYKALIKKSVSVVLALICVFSALSVSASATEKCSEINGYNIGWHDYTPNHTSVARSFLTETKNGDLMRFQGDAADEFYIAEYFSSDFVFEGYKRIEEELPIFGGFYANDNYYFIVSGQENYEESPDVECFRITKYDHNWNKIDSTGLYDCNTVSPFAYGMLRFAEYGEYLIIRTAHEMYASWRDGLNHQANVTILLNTESMDIIDQAVHVSNIAEGYVSHSFNQFIHVEDGKIIALDHGDAYPRSIVLTKTYYDLSVGYLSHCGYLNVLDIPGEEGNNFTGVEVGGFEISSSSYLAAYNSIDFNALDMNDGDMWNSWAEYTGNIFVASVDKVTYETTFHQFTAFDFGTEEHGDPGNPFLVKISEDNFALLWQEGDNIRYTFLNSFGEATESIYTFKNAYLSDCQPIVSDDRILWYSYIDSDIDFYEISLSSPYEAYKTEVNNSHSFVISQSPTAPGGDCTIICEKCGHTETFETGSGFVCYWQTSDDIGYFQSPISKTSFTVGESILGFFSDEDYFIEHNEKIITISDPSAVSVSLAEEEFWNSTYRLTFLKAGTYTITVSYKYNPAVSESVTVYVYQTDMNIPDTQNGSIGDINKNGVIDSMDYLYLKRIYFSQYYIPAEDFYIADIDKNGAITSMDYLYLRRAYFSAYNLG